jgi:hypothetical protein
MEAEMGNYYYHFTNIENLPSIMEKGIIPMNGDNCKLVGDKRTGVCASFGIEGCIVFSARYWYKMMYLYNDEKIAREHFDNSVFLRFDAENINNKYIDIKNFSENFFKEYISPDCLKICYLQDLNGNIEIDRVKIMLYMMKTANFPNRMDLVDFLYKALVKKLYESFEEDLNNFNENEYQLLDLPLSEFLNQNKEYFGQSTQK